MYLCGCSEKKNARNTYQIKKMQFGMYFNRDFEWRVDCDTYQIKNVQFGMYVRGNFV